MKKLFTICLFLNLCNVSFGQFARLSPQTKIFLDRWNQNDQQNLPSSYVYKKINGENYISALIKVNQNLKESDLISAGILTGTIAGSVRTIQIPLNNLNAIFSINGIEYLQLDEPAFPHLNNARMDTRVDSVHRGLTLPMPYNGEDVVIGVVDCGFDFRHPAFYDTLAAEYRVKKVWMQKDSTGTPPMGYAFGSELADSTLIRQAGTDLISSSHGTHVSGIAAGSGFGGQGGNANLRGIGYKSDLVLVGITPGKEQWMNTGITDMIDGINYVFNYAASVSKPAVVNLSWGSPAGPHDGSSLFSTALDALTGPGKIFVCSGGNNGEDTIHLSKTFTPQDSLVQTFLTISDSPEGKKTWLDIWGETGETFCIDIATYNNDTVMFSGLICSVDTFTNIILLDSNMDTCFVTVTASASEFNSLPRIFVELDNRMHDSLLISLTGNSGTVHMWNSFVSNTTGYYGSFRSMNKPFAVDGNSEFTVSDIASSTSAIAVGAYASKITWTNIDGDSYTYASYVAKGNRVPFSSKGPTIDGRVKPDITGPGLTLGSAVSAFDSSFMTTGDGYIFVLNKYHDASLNIDFPYAMLSGTSMSSPAVSGIVSLMLKLKNDLSPADVKSILNTTAITDSWTQTIPPGGNNQWGNGKVNAMGAIREVVRLVTGISAIHSGGMPVEVYPNPATGGFSLNYFSNSSGIVTVECTDLAGKNIFSEKRASFPGVNSADYSDNTLSPGMYMIRVSGNSGSSILKMQVQ